MRSVRFFETPKQYSLEYYEDIRAGPQSFYREGLFFVCPVRFFLLSFYSPIFEE
jgi:hypothetical protein